MLLSRVEDELVHRMYKEMDKVTTETRLESLTLALLVTEDEGDSRVPMYKEKSLARR